MKKRLFLLCIATAIIAGCSKVDEKNNDNLEPIKFSSGITSRAPIVGAIPGTPLSGIQILRAPDAATADWTNVGTVRTTATINALGSVTMADSQYYAVNDTKAWFMAYYPVATSIATNKVSWTITGQEDIIVAPSVGAGSKSAQSTAVLAFAHKLSLLRFKVKAADDDAITQWGTLTYIKVNSDTGLELVPSTGVFDLALTNAKQDLQVANVSYPITLTTSDADAGNVMVYPGALGAVKVKTSLSNEQTVSVSDLTTLVAGSAHEITLTFSTTGISVTATLSDWADGTDGTGTIQ